MLVSQSTRLDRKRIDRHGRVCRFILIYWKMWTNTKLDVANADSGEKSEDKFLARNAFNTRLCSVVADVGAFDGTATITVTYAIIHIARKFSNFVAWEMQSTNQKTQRIEYVSCHSRSSVFWLDFSSTHLFFCFFSSGFVLSRESFAERNGVEKREAERKFSIIIVFIWSEREMRFA